MQCVVLAVLGGVSGSDYLESCRRWLRILYNPKKKTGFQYLRTARQSMQAPQGCSDQPEGIIMRPVSVRLAKLSA